jgi:protein phosphatase 2C-like protein
MTTGCEPAAGWWVHGNGRWVVGEAGRQPETVAVPAEVAGTRPDTSCDGARLGDLDYRAVTLRGLSHCQAGKPRQDAYLLRISANREWLVGCVADGVSAAPFSHLAAEVACRTITRVLAGALGGQPPVTEPGGWDKLVSDLPWQEAVDQGSAAIVARAAAGLPGRDPAVPLDARQVRGTMATTAVAFAVAATRTPDGLVPFGVAVASGDSSALTLSRGRWHPLTTLKNTGQEIASNAVLALPREVTVTPLSGFLQPSDALVVVSDGIGDPLGQGSGAVGQFLAAHWSQPPDLFSFAGQAAFYRKGFTDDRTVTAVWHRPAEGPDGADGPEAAAGSAAGAEPDATAEPVAADGDAGAPAAPAAAAEAATAPPPGTAGHGH